MKLPRLQRQFFYLIVITLALITGSSSITTLLPKEMQAQLFPTPTRVKTPITYPTSYPGQKLRVQVAKVIDGDTIELTDGRKLRYIGINAPESVDPRRAVQCYGKGASQANTTLVQGAIIEIERDISETDKYGRLLRYVYKNGIMVNETLVREGFALSSSYPPDVKHQEILKVAERKAQEEKKGLWGMCKK